MPDPRWEAAGRQALVRDETLTAAINAFLERYGRGYDPNYSPEWVRDVWTRSGLGNELEDLADELGLDIPGVIRFLIAHYRDTPR